MPEVVRAVARGALAGAAGTAAMTAAQTAYYKATGSEASSVPAEVARRVIGGVLRRPVPEVSDDVLNNAMHWAYGIGWGTLLGLSAAGRRPGSGVAFGLVVWGASLVHLPAMKLAPPVWDYDARTISSDVGFHTLYGVTATLAYKQLEQH